MMIFENPTNGYKEVSKHEWFWALLFGCFYFFYKGAFGAGCVTLFLALVTAGLSWVFVPIYARQIIRKTYLRKGWQETC